MLGNMLLPLFFRFALNKKQFWCMLNLFSVLFFMLAYYNGASQRREFYTYLINYLVPQEKIYLVNHPPLAATVTTYFSVVSAAHLYLLLFSFNKVLVCIAACCGVPETAGGQNAWNSLFLLSVDTDPFFLLLLFLFPLFLHRKQAAVSVTEQRNESIQDMLRSIENRNRLMHLSET